MECGSIMIIGRLLTASDLLTLAMPDQVALQVHRPAQLHRRTAGGKQADGRRHDAQELAPHAAQQRFLELLTVASAGIGADASRQSLIEPYWT